PASDIFHLSLSPAPRGPITLSRRIRGLDPTFSSTDAACFFRTGPSTGRPSTSRQFYSRNRT
ncbi:MAG TPA: hypothetical protein PKW66_07100, partial [Polyangiaceae bacterium]|nr:hypothetical protein [Polyangiaceae bacterium]